MNALRAVAGSARSVGLWGIESVAFGAGFAAKAMRASASKLAAGTIGAEAVGDVLREATETGREVGQGVRNLAVVAGDVPAYFADRAVTLVGEQVEPVRSVAELFQNPKRSINSFEVLVDMIELFLHGPVAIVLDDTRSQIRRQWVEAKVRHGARMTIHDIWRIRHSLVGISQSSLYPEGYLDQVYPQLQELLSAAVNEQLEGATYYPPSEALMQIAHDMDIENIRHTIDFLERSIDDLASDPEILSQIDTGSFARGFDKAKKDDTRAADSGVDQYERYDQLAWRLIREVSLGAATGFLSRAIVTTPDVEPFLRAVDRNPMVLQKQLPPPAVRVFMYVADANLEGESIYSVSNPLHRARVPFPPETSQLARDFLDAYIDAVVSRAPSSPAIPSVHPFSSAARIIDSAMIVLAKDDIRELSLDEVECLAEGPSHQNEVYPRFKKTIAKTLDFFQEAARRGVKHEYFEQRFTTRHAQVLGQQDGARAG